MWSNRHTTPFESVTFSFEVKAPIFVIRQWHRHRTWSYNEVSARYTKLPEEYYIPEPEMIGEQSKTHKQARVISSEPPYDDTRKMQVEWYGEFCEAAFHQYHCMLAAGWPRELARMVLPLSTYTHMFATVNLLNLFKFIGLRADEHAQYEIRAYAEAIKQLIKPVVPVCYDAFIDFGA